MQGLDLANTAQQRLAEELLAWGQPRPQRDDTIAVALRDIIESGVAALEPDVTAAAAAEPRGHILVTKTRLDRIVCDGYAIDAQPFRHSRASMRGILAHAIIERDWHEQRARSADEVVADVWHDEASRRPGDPGSASAWMNSQSPPEAAALRAELADLLHGFRDVWPLVPQTVVDASLERALGVSCAAGLVRLFGRPDVILASKRHDSYARTLVVDFKTGQARPEHDRHELRFYALLATLVFGAPPFRWATYYVTEGRYDVEDLRRETLEVTARRVVDGIRQQVRIATKEDDALVIRGGAWCRWCTRKDSCEEAARAHDMWMSQSPDSIEP